MEEWFERFGHLMVEAGLADLEIPGPVLMGMAMTTTPEQAAATLIAQFGPKPHEWRHTGPLLMWDRDTRQDTATITAVAHVVLN